jgi:hypothetical protein
MRGRQKRAILQVLRQPMTGKQICLEARRIDHHIQLRDVWFVMRQFQKRGLTRCLNPGQVTGKLYCLTDFGRKIVLHAFKLKIPALPVDVPWKKYSLVVRAKTRRMLIMELGKFASLNLGEATAARIRKRLNETYPIGLNPVMRSLRELTVVGVVEWSGITRNQQRKTYRLTREGERIRKQLLILSEMPS